jgi:hypothetical protein
MDFFGEITISRSLARELTKYGARTNQDVLLFCRLRQEFYTKELMEVHQLCIQKCIEEGMVEGNPRLKESVNLYYKYIYKIIPSVLRTEGQRTIVRDVYALQAAIHRAYDRLIHGAYDTTIEMIEVDSANLKNVTNAFIDNSLLGSRKRTVVGKQKEKSSLQSIVTVGSSTDINVNANNDNNRTSTTNETDNNDSGTDSIYNKSRLEINRHYKGRPRESEIKLGDQNLVNQLKGKGYCND